MIVSFWDGLTDCTFIPHLDPKKNGRTFHEILFFLIEILMSYGIILGSHKSSSPKSQTKNRWAVGFFLSTILSTSGLFEAFANARPSPLQFLDRRPELNVGHVVNFPAPRRNNKKKQNTAPYKSFQLLVLFCCFFSGLCFFEIPRYWNHQ